MAEYPAMPLWTDSYLADTLDLSAEQHGCYLVLLMLSWRRPDCSLPDDMRWLRRSMGTCCGGMHGNRFNALVPPLLRRFFQQDSDGNWQQKRLRKERDFLQKTSRKQRENVEKRWAKSKVPNGLDDTNAVPPGITPTPTPTPIPKKKDPSAAAAETRPTRARAHEEAQDGAAAPAADAAREDPPSAVSFCDHALLTAGANPATTLRTVRAWADCYGSGRTEVALQRALRRAHRSPLDYAEAVLEGRDSERNAAVEAARHRVDKPPPDNMAEGMKLFDRVLETMRQRKEAYSADAAMRELARTCSSVPN